MRIAAIDIGTNSIHMVIADAVSLGAFEVVDREREVVQIGRGSFATGRLRRAAMDRTVDALVRFVQLARRMQSDRVLCTATAAVREARNGGVFLQAAREASGLNVRVIPAEEEGRLIYLAVKAAVQLPAAPSLVVDVGGGSVQLVVGDRERLRFSLSAPLGALRLTETMIEHDPPTRGDLDRLRRDIRKQSRAALERVAETDPVRAYGSSGSIHALAQMAHTLEHGSPIAHMNGHVLHRDALARATRRIARMSHAEREKLPGLDQRRAEIIVPAALTLLHVLDTLGLDGITVSDFGVREGLVTDYIEHHADEVTRLAPIEDLRLRSVVQLLSKFQADGAHPRHVTKLALALWDGFRRVHRLPAETRELLQYAAMLHDIGSVIGFDGHAEHSAYVIRNGNLRGFSADEVRIMACVARYHGKGRPRRRDPDIRSLDRRSRRAVRWLAAVMRIAEGLDRSHYQLIRDLKVTRRGERWMIRVTARRDAQLELWAARRRTELLAERIGSRRHPATVRVMLEAGSMAGAKKAEPRREERARETAETTRSRTGSGEAARARGAQSGAVPALKVVARR
jgi:exopolyphosphatase / guanosine-5'-triphosphate,3'-diphosphate pyrophosphatase